MKESKLKELDMTDIGNLASEVCDDLVEHLRRYKIFVPEEEMLDIVDDEIF